MSIESDITIHCAKYNLWNDVSFSAAIFCALQTSKLNLVELKCQPVQIDKIRTLGRFNVRQTGGGKNLKTSHPIRAIFQDLENFLTSKVKR